MKVMRARIPLFATASLAVCAAGFAASKIPTVADAQAFLQKAEAQLTGLNIDSSRADWIRANFITDDTEAVAAKMDQAQIDATVRYAKESVQFDRIALPPAEQRKLKLLKNALTLATPSDPAEAEEVTRLASSLEGSYGKGKYCRTPDKCLDLEDITKILRTSRDPKELADVWTGWHAVGGSMRQPYQRFVTVANKGARELGFADMGAMWRAKYDMPPESFAAEVDRLWEQVRPLYVSLHAYVRNRLREKYGDAVPANGPIPAHLLGNMWGQEWQNIYDLVAPPNADPGYDLTRILLERNTDYKQMVRYGERFFTSLGFDPLPPTFWERSLFVKPRDREVVCHASAWDVDLVNDLRIKMCIDINADDFITIHHELGHNFYQRAYNQQPLLFRDSANDGFHEAIGDTIALSVTPEYLVKIGLLQSAPDPSKDIGLLMDRALQKVAFLPFGLLIDKYRWQVFSGQIPPDKLNQAFWDLKLKYQGIAPPEPRTEADFDPAAKYHVASNTPYMRYFLADILQFQFHRALAKEAGCTGPLNRCSIYGDRKAGAKLANMLRMGASRPWQDALQAVTGQRQMDATAMMDYFAPLKAWLDEQNAGKPQGW
jgi:peptidyl-dipeptidase A